MNSADALAKEWLDLALSKAAVIHEVEEKWRHFQVTKPEEYRVTFELETRANEARMLKSQLEGVHVLLSDSRKSNSEISDAIDEVVSECSAIERHCVAILGEPGDAPDAAVDSKWSSASAQPGKNAKASLVKYQYPHVQDQKWLSADQRFLSEISSRSSILAEMLSSGCEAEMARTRSLDQLIDEAESSLSLKLKQLREISELRSQLMAIRREYDAQLVDDFQTLTDLALTVESLEAELSKAKRARNAIERKSLKSSSQTNQSVVVPIRESTLQLQDQVARLAAELSTKEEYYRAELSRLTQELNGTKTRKIRLKSNFQQKLKSVFKDFEFLADRADKAESALEKANLHHQLSEQEILEIVSPIMESIDRARERVDLLAADAEEALYGEDNNESLIHT